MSNAGGYLTIYRSGSLFGLMTRTSGGLSYSTAASYATSLSRW
jgi:hypothetical protein